MYIIKSPNKYYNGMSANIQFKNGIAECELQEHVVEWLKSKGYEVLKEAVKEKSTQKNKKGDAVGL